MTTPVANVYNDFSGLAKLRVSARQDGQGALQEVAQQFEAIFTQMLLKSMRAASLGDGIFDSGQSKAYQDMFDQQMSVTMASGGKGMGIADMLMRQLGNVGASAAPDAMKLPAAVNAVAPANAAGSAGLPNPVELAVRRAMERVGEAAGNVVNDVAEALPGDAVAFLQKIAPHAKAAADTLGVSLRAVLSQVALETGWGKHVPTKADGQSSFNLFGIKAGSSWGGERVVKSTHEVENGVATRRDAAFRAYDDPAAAFADYARLLGASPRYAAVSGHGDDVAGFAHALQRAGYATDPAYAAKLSAIADSAPMRNALATLAAAPAAVDAAGTRTAPPPMGASEPAVAPSWPATVAPWAAP
jgi:flagellar protein FlgJ